MDQRAGADIARRRKGTQDDVEAVGSFFDGGFGEASDLEEATRDGGVASGVEGGRRFRFVGSEGSVWVERGAGADIDFNLVEGADGFDDSEPAEGRARFGEGGGLAWRFAAVTPRFQSGQRIAVENEAQDDVKNYGGKRDRCPDFAARAF